MLVYALNALLFFVVVGIQDLLNNKKGKDSCKNERNNIAKEYGKIHLWNPIVCG